MGKKKLKMQRLDRGGVLPHMLFKSTCMLLLLGSVVFFVMVLTVLSVRAAALVVRFATSLPSV